ncbi:MAG: GNAT family N-acetyltransferase [Desulfobaccales bacterium]
MDQALNQAKGLKVGYFSLFESINDQEVAGHLFEAAATWLGQRKLVECKGPVAPGGPQEDHGKGLLVDGFHRPPALLTAYNPPYYQKLLESHGFRKDFDLYAYLLETERVLARTRIPEELYQYACRRYNLHLRPVDFKNPERDIPVIKRVLDLAVPDTWPDVLPPSLEEVRSAARDLKKIADPDFTVIAWAGDEPVGFAAALPDYNQVFIHMNGRFTPLALCKFFHYKRKITRFRLFIIFVIPAFRKKGIAQALCYPIFKHALAKGYRHGEGSIIGEQNIEMRRDIEKAGGIRDKTYRIYQKSLGEG